MLPAWQESSLDAHISCWSPRRARGPWGVVPLGDQGMFYGPRVSGPLSLLVLRRVLWPDHLLPLPLRRPEAPWECDPGVTQPAGPSLMTPCLPEAWTALVPGSPLPQPKTLPSHPGPELLPPSSFMPCGVEAPARVSPPGHLGSHSLVWPSVLFLMYSVL